MVIPSYQNAQCHQKVNICPPPKQTHPQTLYKLLPPKLLPPKLQTLTHPSPPTHLLLPAHIRHCLCSPKFDTAHW